MSSDDKFHMLSRVIPSPLPGDYMYFERNDGSYFPVLKSTIHKMHNPVAIGLYAYICSFLENVHVLTSKSNLMNRFNLTIKDFNKALKLLLELDLVEVEYLGKDELLIKAK